MILSLFFTLESCKLVRSGLKGHIGATSDCSQFANEYDATAGWWSDYARANCIGSQTAITAQAGKHNESNKEQVYYPLA